MSKNDKYDSLGYYKILDTTYLSSDDEIRQKYRELAKFWHPDHNSADNALDMFQKISVAYDILKEPDTRLRYTLLSIIYEKENFPDLSSLCVLRNMHGQEDLNMRAFHLTEITGKGILHSTIDKIYFCSPYEAPHVIKQIAKHNWLFGFWGISALFRNTAAIIQNIRRINGKKENLTLLLHNALAYESERKKEEAFCLASQALEYAEKNESVLIKQYMNTFSQTPLLTVKKWPFKKLKRIQLFYPAIFFLLILLTGISLFLYKAEISKKNSVNVKEIVVFNNGQKVFSDIAVAKFFDIPVDAHDKTRLYHLTKTTKAMHGADKSFDVFGTVEEGTTVRLTGYTADKKWFRVMFDSGEMAFIEADKLQEGIGKEIPLWSKIYKD